MATLIANMFRSILGIGLAGQAQAPPITPEHEDEKTAHLRALLKSPRIPIQVVDRFAEYEYFYVPKALLTKHSTTIRTALRNRGYDNLGPLCFLGVNSYVWLTFEAWLYEQNLDSLEAFFVTTANYEMRLVNLYAFAQQYGVNRMSDQVVALVKQRDVPIICAALKLATRIFDKQGGLCRVLVEAEAANSQRPQDEISQLPVSFVREAMRIACARTIDNANHADT